MRKTPIGIILLFALLFAFIFAAGCIDLKDLLGSGENISFNISDWDGSQKNLTSSIYGIITDLKKAPLESASVMLIGDASNYSGFTDASGKYNLSGVPAGTYTIVVWKAEYRNVTLANFTFLGGYSYPWNVTLSSITGGLYGTITDLKKVPLENATVSLIGTTQNYSQISDENGKYNITELQPGVYDLLVQKLGRKNWIFANFTILEGQSYSWNVTIARDCIYYAVNTSTNYVLRYGFNGTIYRGEMDFVVTYPKGATYDLYPAAGSGLSRISTGYVAGNRVLKWKLDNSEGSYSYVEGHIYVNMNGTGTMQLYDQKEMSISDAASRQPNYLGSETTANGRKLINPSNSEIKATAQQVKSETGSNDTWTVAKALFIWLKSNTVYYIDPKTSDYSHLPTEVLHSGKGKCDELAHLYISLLRADNIPSRFVKGYIASRNPGRYLSHVWVEFYDGEWVPVEVAGTGNASDEANTHFAVQRPDHVEVFMDDGTSESIGEGDASTGIYYDQPAVFPFNIYYDAISYDQMYIAACSDGTRELEKEME